MILQAGGEEGNDRSLNGYSGNFEETPEETTP
jgi:hypothetical protein